MPGQSEVGGGSFPGAELPTTLVALSHPSPDILVTALRHSDVPIVARVADQHVLFDVRTLADGEVPVVAAAVATALES
jgi:L-seryl-tRNA(Ser) seleniumtransferase